MSTPRIIAIAVLMACATAPEAVSLADNPANSNWIAATTEPSVGAKVSPIARGTGVGRVTGHFVSTWKNGAGVGCVGEGVGGVAVHVRFAPDVEKALKPTLHVQVLADLLFE